MEIFICEICNYIKMDNLYDFAINIYYNIKNKINKDYFGYAIACVLISNWLASFKSGDINKIKANILELNNSYSANKLFNFVINIHLILDWKLYPIYLPNKWGANIGAATSIEATSIEETSIETTSIETTNSRKTYVETTNSRKTYVETTNSRKTYVEPIINVSKYIELIENKKIIISNKKIIIINEKGKEMLLTIDKKIVWNTFQLYPDFWNIFTIKNENNKQVATKQKYIDGFNFLLNLV